MTHGTPATSRHIAILTALCNLPTAPYREDHVIAWLLAWAGRHKQIRVRRDRARNVYLEYQRGKRTAAPLVIEAHMDHPGFVVTRQERDGTIKAEFRGGVRPSHFTGATAKFWLDDGDLVPLRWETHKEYAPRGRWISAKVRQYKPAKKGRFPEVTLTAVRERLPAGTIGMWDLPDVAIKNGLLSARVCDDLGGVATIICLLEELIAKKVPAHVIGLCSRAEEVGFAGVLAVCENGWIPRRSPVIGLETSKASAGAPQGAGPVIRVGDKAGLFSPGLTHFLTQAAGHIADRAPASRPFAYQRKLMDGGTCNSTAFAAWGYDSAAMCVALGNYHNMTIQGDVGWGDPKGGRKAGPGIASETIHLNDFAGMVQVLVETVRRISAYKPGFGFMRDRLARLHATEQTRLLYVAQDSGAARQKRAAAASRGRPPSSPHGPVPTASCASAACKCRR